ncbi:MAG: DUF5658 family protein [Acidobacteriota bacterium]
MRNDASDRRNRPTNPLSRRSLLGSRQRIRRADDRKRHYYVDRYGLYSSLVFVLVLALSVADAYLTLQLVASGGEEANPVMAFFLRFGPLPFLLVKYFVTGLSLMFILVHKEYPLGGRLRVESLMILLLGLYAALILYEFSLLARL